MNGTREPFLGWPGWTHLRYACRPSALNGLWFLLIYGGCDWITAHRALRVPVHFQAELNLPFVPAVALIYLSIYVLFLAAPFVVRTRRAFRALVITLAVVIGVGGIGFLLVPAELAFPRPANLGRWVSLYDLADRLNLTYNLVPSLHVALSVVCVGAFAERTRFGGKAFLWTWAAAISASTVLTHQHHLLDVGTGWFVAWAAYRLVYARLAAVESLPTAHAEISRVRDGLPEAACGCGATGIGQAGESDRARQGR